MPLAQRCLWQQPAVPVVRATRRVRPLRRTIKTVCVPRRVANLSSMSAQRVVELTYEQLLSDDDLSAQLEEVRRRARRFAPPLPLPPQPPPM